MRKNLLTYKTVALFAFSLFLAVICLAAFIACKDETTAYFTVTFYKNDGDSHGVITTKHIYEKDGFLIGNLPEPPVRDNHVFLGWDEDKNADTPRYDNEYLKNTLIVTGNMSLYAIWEPASVTVSLNSHTELFLGLDDALDYIADAAEAGDYLVGINNDQTLMHYTFSQAGKNIILATAGEAAITRYGAGDLFTVTNGITLTLKSGITLKGAPEFGRGVVVNNGTFIMDGGAITGNTTPLSGAGVYVDNGEFIMKGGTISDNITTATPGGGGGVYVGNSGTFTMENSTITKNKATGTSGNGGGVFVSVNRNFTMKNGLISENEAVNGGGVYCVDSSGVNHTVFSMEDGAISKNKASVNGGGVYSGGQFTLQEGTINANNAAGGGGVYINYDTFTMENGYITGNEAAANGGGVYNRTEFIMAYGTISENKANNGGGIYSSSLNLTIKKGFISDNKAKENGGGIYNGSSFFTMQDGTIDGNKAACGGGVYNAENKAFTMEKGNITGNTANYGGGIYNVWRTTMRDGTIGGNTAEEEGGGVYIEYSTDPISGSTSSFAKEDGIIYGNEGTVSAANQNNAGADGKGHAVYVDGTPPVSYDTTIDYEKEFYPEY